MAPEMEGVSTAFTPQAMPLPRRLVPEAGSPGWPHPTASAARCTDSFRPQAWIGVPVTKRSPSSSACSRRNSTGSLPRPRATMSICES